MAPAYVMMLIGVGIAAFFIVLLAVARKLDRNLSERWRRKPLPRPLTLRGNVLDIRRGMP
ncbi:MAG: hypothetical protein LBR80_07245 [Deltaproteobacteria bacterium]|jgi:hypothetical protein|nr:hypothetical protein [Deltaproteobacteria bacterium]